MQHVHNAQDDRSRNDLFAPQGVVRGSKGMSRRNFLTAAAAVATTGAVTTAGVTPTAAAAVPPGTEFSNSKPSQNAEQAVIAACGRLTQLHRLSETAWA